MSLGVFLGWLMNTIRLLRGVFYVAINAVVGSNSYTTGVFSGWRMVEVKMLDGPELVELQSWCDFECSGVQSSPYLRRGRPTSSIFRARCLTWLEVVLPWR